MPWATAFNSKPPCRARHRCASVGPRTRSPNPRLGTNSKLYFEFAAGYALPQTLIGSGFNCLVADKGIDGVVINLRKFRELQERPGPAIYAEAGVSHSAITRFCTDRGFTGMEFAAGIPGTVGGWIMMNAGIGVREQKDVALEVGIVSPDGTGEESIGRSALDFRYRELRGLPDGAVVISALFGVEKSSKEAVKAEVDRLLAHRSSTQPLDVPSCGSVFRNPEGDFAGRLIEQAGLCGERVGGAEISTVHANFIANRGGATAADVLALIGRAQSQVQERFGITLQREVHVMGRTE